MKVQLTTEELRAALRHESTRSNGKVMTCEVEFDVQVAQVQEREGASEALSPEEQIRRNPALALDAPERPPSYREVVKELLRWFHRPRDAGGMTVDVPQGHPSGFGGSTVYIPHCFLDHPADACQPSTHAP